MAERSSLESRVKEKRAEVERLERKKAEAIDEYEKFQAGLVLNYVHVLIRDADPVPALEEAMTTMQRVDWGSCSLAVLKPMYESLRSRILQAREFVASHVKLMPTEHVQFDQWISENRLDLANVDRAEAEYSFQ